MNAQTQSPGSRLSNDTLTHTLVGLSEMYEKPLSQSLIEVWGRVLVDLSEEEFLYGVRTYLIGPSSAFMPKPGQIYRLARPEADIESEAMMLVESIFRTLGPCGGDRDGSERAKQKLAPAAWKYVEQYGGWSRFAREMQMIDEGDVLIAKSQARKSIMGLIEYSRSAKAALIENQEAEILELPDQPEPPERTCT